MPGPPPAQTSQGPELLGKADLNGKNKPIGHSGSLHPPTPLNTIPGKTLRIQGLVITASIKYCLFVLNKELCSPQAVLPSSSLRSPVGLGEFSSSFNSRTHTSKPYAKTVVTRPLRGRAGIETPAGRGMATVPFHNLHTQIQSSTPP